MIYNPTTTDQARKYLDKLIAKGARFELKELKDQRSNPQNRYIHLLLGIFCRETGYTLPEAKNVLKRVITPDIFTYSRTLGGHTYLHERSTSDLNKAEMTQVISRFRHFCNEELGFYLPDANGVPDEVIMDAMENELNYDYN